MANTDSNLTKVLLFSGAGLSCPLGLPMTNEFKDVIDSGDTGLMHILKSHLGSNFYDIEAILNSIEELNSTDNLIYKYISANIGNSSFTTVKQGLDALRNKSLSYESNLKKSIHSKLATHDISKCEQLYFNILKEIRTTIPNSAISFFTSNYDLTFENSIGDSDSLQRKLQITTIDYGFTQRGSSTFEASKEYTWLSDVLEFKKIHGSLDWLTDIKGRTTKSYAANTPDNPDSVPILYPGFKGTPQKEPFLSLHRQFLKRMIDAHFAVFMGFAFRDPYMNSLIDMALDLNKELNILCYNLSNINDLPIESHIHKLNKSPKRFKYIQEEIAITDNPLKIAGKLKK